MLESEALEFFNTELLPIWKTWEKNISNVERSLWATAFKPYSYQDALRAVEVYFTTSKDTKFKPTVQAVLGCVRRSDDKVRDFVWIQNTKSGIFHPRYILGDKEKALKRLFQDAGAPYGGGNWKLHEQAKGKHDELFAYRSRKAKGLKSAIEHVESEAEAAIIIETYQVDPRSTPARQLKKAVRKLKDKKSKQHQQKAIKELKDETSNGVAEFMEEHGLDDSDIESMHPTESDTDDLF